MQYDKKIDKLQIARTNKYNVTRCIIRKGPINRAAIAKQLNLSIPTVMWIADDLIKKEIIRSVGKGESGVGKHPELLEIIPDSFFYVGADVGRTTIRIVINNAAEEEIIAVQKPTGDTFPVKSFVNRLGRFILQTVKKMKIENNRILGAGIAMPGLIESGSGQVLISPDFGWKDIPLQSWLQKQLPYPILVRNSNHALALNESYIQKEEMISHTTFCISLGYGIGAALVNGEELYFGSSGASGELGHSVVEKDGPLCKCGNSGCLESVASGEAIARQAQTVVAHHGKSIMAKLCGEDPSSIDAKIVFKAAEMGDVLALKIIDSAAEYIGIGLSTAVNVLDPDRVILGGGLMQNGPYFPERIRLSMEKHIIPRANRQLELRVGVKGEYSTANGACRVLMNDLWIRRSLPI
jgi:predicted NBD/HSP70 family sugar kinase